MAEFLAFVWSSLASPQGMCVAVIFAALIWLQVGVQRLRDRAAERAHLAELNQVLADMPAPPRAAKTLFTDPRKDPRHAA